MKSSHQCLVAVLLLAVGYSAAEIRDKNWWKNAVFYQVYPRSFMDSDGDGVGDIKGVTSKLQHLADSGITGLWLSPINKSPMVDFGYDISDYRDIDETFGTLADFEELVRQARKLGLKVFLDFVPNHTSDMHDWFMRSVKRDGKYTNYYVWKDGSPNKPPNNWISLFGGPAWTYHPERKQWYLHQFARQQPDLNFANPDVQKEMQDILEFWLDKGVDGFRIDAVPHIFEDERFPDEPRSNTSGASSSEYKYLNHIYTKDHPQTYSLIQKWRNFLDNYANTRNLTEKVMMTEAYTSLVNTTRFYSVGSHIPFNFKFITEVNKDSSAGDFKRIIDEWMNAMPKSGVPNWVMGNHDRKRTPTRYPGRGDQMNMLSMILPGVTVTYYGEEIGMLDNDDITFEEGIDPQGCNAGRAKFKQESRDFCRTPFQWNNKKHAGFSNGSDTWLPVNKNYNELNLEMEKSKADSPYKVYTALTNLRKSSPVLQQGDLNTRVLNKNVLLVERTYKNERIVLLMNFSDKESYDIGLKDAASIVDAAVLVASTGSNIPKFAKLSNVALPTKAGVVLKGNVV